MDQDRIIAEQRDQLMQLRAENARLKAGPDLRELQRVVGTYKGKSKGRTIGFRVADEIRERVIAQQKKVGARSYRQLVEACLELGLRQIESVKDDDTEGAVAKVQDVQRSSDQGNGSVRAAASY